MNTLIASRVRSSARFQARALAAPRAGWLIAALGLLPLLQGEARAEETAAQSERLQWLLATHDVRYAIQAPREKSDCIHKGTERSR